MNFGRSTAQMKIMKRLSPSTTHVSLTIRQRLSIPSTKMQKGHPTISSPVMFAFTTVKLSIQAFIYLHFVLRLTVVHATAVNPTAHIPQNGTTPTCPNMIAPTMPAMLTAAHTPSTITIQSNGNT